MNAVDLLGHFAYVLLCLGTVLIAKYPGKNAGWLLRAAGDGMWVGLGFYLGLTSCVVWGALFTAIDLAPRRREAGKVTT